MLKKVSLKMMLESSSTCYCSKRLRKRVPNGRSRDTERSLPELSPGSGYDEVWCRLLCDRSRLTGSVTSLMYAGAIFMPYMCQYSVDIFSHIM